MIRVVLSMYLSTINASRTKQQVLLTNLDLIYVGRPITNYNRRQNIAFLEHIDLSTKISIPIGSSLIRHSSSTVRSSSVYTPYYIGSYFVAIRVLTLLLRCLFLRIRLTVG